jgi:hypothetical protein
MRILPRFHPIDAVVRRSTSFRFGGFRPAVNRRHSVLAKGAQNVRKKIGTLLFGDLIEGIAIGGGEIRDCPTVAAFAVV